MNNSLSIRVIHNYKLKERRDYLESKLIGFGDLQFIEIEMIAPEFPTYLYSGGNVTNWVRKTKNLWKPPPPFRVLSTPEISVTASHYYAYSTFNTEWCLVLEDDAIPPSDLMHQLDRIISTCPNQVDIVFLGGGFELDRVCLKLGAIADFAICHHPATNTTVSYLVRKKCAIKLLLESKNFDLPIDFELAYQLQNINAIVLHLQPYIISEGSKSIYPSSIEPYRVKNELDLK